MREYLLYECNFEILSAIQYWPKWTTIAEQIKNADQKLNAKKMLMLKKATEMIISRI